MNKLPLLLFAFLLLSPLAEAQYSAGSCLPPVLCVTNEDLSEPIGLGNQDGQTWTWTALPGYFNFTAVTPPNYANDSLTRVYFEAGQNQIISDSTTYEWRVYFTDSIMTHSILASVEYHRFGWFSAWDPFPHTTVHYLISYDGVTLLPYNTGVNWNSNPNPTFVFNMQRHATDGNATLFSKSNQSVDNANLLTGFAYPEVKILDAFGGTGGGGGVSRITGNPVDLIPEAQGFTVLPITNFTQFGALPSVQMSTNQGSETQTMRYQFQKYSTESQGIANKAVDGVKQSCSFDINFGPFHFCVSGLLSSIWDFLVGLISIPIAWFFSIIPGLDGVKNLMLSIISSVFGYFKLITTIIFTSGPNYPPGGIFIALIALASALSFPVWALTGSFSFIWKFPFLFIKWLLKGTYVFGKFVFIDIPLAVITMFADMIP